MTQAFIYDAVRTPRGKGRKDGRLHGATPVHLAATTLAALRERNQLDTSAIDNLCSAAWSRLVNRAPTSRA